MRDTRKMGRVIIMRLSNLLTSADWERKDEVAEIAVCRACKRKNGGEEKVVCTRHE